MLGVLLVRLGGWVEVEIQLQHHLREVVMVPEVVMVAMEKLLDLLQEVMVPLEKLLDLLREVLVRLEFWARW